MAKTYRVIEIIDNTSILINAGTRNGVSKGDLVRVIEIGENVIDPETKHCIGTLDYLKDELEIVVAYPSFSLCKKLYHKKVNMLQPLTSKVLTIDTSIEKLNVNKDQISNRKLDGNPVISVGDLVKIV